MKKEKILETIKPLLLNKRWKLDKYGHYIKEIRIDDVPYKYRIKCTDKVIRIERWHLLIKEWGRMDSQYYGNINIVSDQIELSRLAVITDNRTQLFAKINLGLWGQK